MYSKVPKRFLETFPYSKVIYTGRDDNATFCPRVILVQTQTKAGQLISALTTFQNIAKRITNYFRLNTPFDRLLASRAKL